MRFYLICTCVWTRNLHFVIRQISVVGEVPFYFEKKIEVMRVETGKSKNFTQERWQSLYTGLRSAIFQEQDRAPRKYRHPLWTYFPLKLNFNTRLKEMTKFASDESWKFEIICSIRVFFFNVYSQMTPNLKPTGNSIEITGYPGFKELEYLLKKSLF